MNEVLLPPPRVGDRGAGVSAPRDAVMRRMKTAGAAIALVGAVLVGLASVPAAQAADDCPNAAVRAQQEAQSLPGCRAYEQVTPVDKSEGPVAFPAGGIFPEFQQAAQPALDYATPDGNAVSYYSYAAFGDPQTGMMASYRSRRTPDGWTARQWSPKTRLPHPVLSNGQALVFSASEDLETGFTLTADDFDPLEGRGDYWLDVYAIRPGGGVTWESRPNANVPVTTPVSSAPLGNSADGSTVLFQNSEALVPEAAGLAPGITGLYMRRDGLTRLLGLRADGTVISACGAGLGSVKNAAGGSGTSVTGAISRDGSRIFITAPDPGQISSGDPSCAAPQQIYMRTSAGAMVRVSASQRNVPDGAHNARFLGATSDGEVVFFSTPEALTNDAEINQNEKLYRYRLSSGKLTLVSGGNNAGGLIGFSDDGSRVYFINGNKVELADGAAVSTVATFSTVAPPEGWTQPQARVTPDGRFLLMATSENLTTFDSHGAIELYRFDVIDSSMVCVSCNATGVAPAGDARLGGDTSGNGIAGYPLIRNLSSDGQRVAFDTKDALVAQDTNANSDVYLWDNGKTHLISRGTGGLPSVLFDVSADGNDIFFGTAERLTDQDADGGDYDLYDARVDGGFLSPAKPMACSGDVCQGAAANGAELVVAGSLTFGGSGDQPSDARPAKGKVTVGKLSAVSGSEATLKVRVPGAGVLSATGASIQRSSRTAVKAGTLMLKVRLSGRARRSLIKRRSLKVPVRLAFTPKAGEPMVKSVTLTYKKPRAANRGAVSGKSKKGGR